MKFKKVSLAFTAALALGLAACSKSEPVTPAADDANKAASSTADTVAKDEAAKAADVAKAEAAKTAEAANAEAAKTADNAKSQGLIDKAKSLVAEGKFGDAANVLQQLSGQPLSDEQQTLVDGLKTQIQQAIAAKTAENAAGKVDNLLKK
jgi:hypothetical protein